MKQKRRLFRLDMTSNSLLYLLRHTTSDWPIAQRQFELLSAGGEPGDKQDDRRISYR
jgi:hypothetical protein